MTIKMDFHKNLVTLAIESSCDETSVSVVRNGLEVLSNVIASQIDIHKLYGGVVPEIASRNHLLKVSSVTKSALDEANMTFEDIDFISVTNGPGLIGALLVGLSYAKGLSFALGKDLVGVNHLQGHISSSFLLGAKPPFICLTASGGHTNITLVKDYTSFEILGSTRDDAAGEAFDKVARVLGLGYPGGSKLDELANLGNEEAISFPKVMLEENSYDFSFSGLKSAVLNYLNSKKQKNEEIKEKDVAASFRKAVIDVLVAKSILACKNNNISTLTIGGGVACNSLLRKELKEKCIKENISIFIPEPIYCTDNAAMIGCAGYYNYINGKKDNIALNAYANLPLGDKRQ